MQLVSRYGFSVALIILMTFVWVLHGFASVSLPDGVTVTISFILFLLPGGIFAHWMLGNKDWNWAQFVAFGLPISIGIVGLISLPVRTMNLSMTHIILILYILSVIGIIWARLRYQNFRFMMTSSQSGNRMVIGLATAAVIIVILLALTTPYTMRKDNDVLLHSAEITHYASDIPLDWEEIYFDTGNQVWERVSLAIWRVAQGGIAWSSNVHAFYSQLVVSPLLLIYLGFAVYVSARLFNVSVQNSLLITIIHLLCFLLLTDSGQAGSDIFSRIIRDKVLAGYAFTPIVLGIAWYVIQTQTVRAYAFYALVLIGTIFTHPILTGFMLMVIGGWMLLNMVFTRRVVPFLLIVLLSGVLFSPLLVIRFTTDQAFNFGEETLDPGKNIWFDEETQLYMVNPDSVGGVAFALLIFTGVTSLIHMYKDEFSRFVFAHIVVMSLSLIPYTAWIYAYFVSVDHIIRALWILLYGLFFYYFVATWAQHIMSRLPFKWKQNYTMLIQSIVIGIGLIAMLMHVGDVLSNRLERHNEQMALQSELIAVGDYIESQTDTPVVVTGFHDYIGAISHLTKPVSFCNARCMIAFTNISEDEARLRHNFKHRFHGYFEGHDNEKRISEMNQYRVEYILTTPDNEILNALFAAYPDDFELVFQTKSIYVMHYLSD